MIYIILNYLLAIHIGIHTCSFVVFTRYKSEYSFHNVQLLYIVFIIQIDRKYVSEVSKRKKMYPFPFSLLSLSNELNTMKESYF